MTLLKRYLKKIISEAIEEISEAEGEGAMLIIVNDKVNVENFVACMDKDNLQMEWRKKNKPMKFLDKTLLRAMLIMDGATLIKSESDSSTIEPRFLVYPHHDNRAFSVLDNSNTLNDYINLGVLKGKGSRHHGAANLSVLLLIEQQESLQNTPLPFSIITISADGPVKQWPNVLKKNTGGIS